MLEIIITGREAFNEKTNEIIRLEDTKIKLEHSLISLSKWESKWHKHFIGNKSITTEELLDYIRCMTITQNVDPNLFLFMDKANIAAIKQYIDDPMTATTIKNDPNRRHQSRIITSEVIYSRMFDLNIPIDCEKWHLNRLLTLIEVCGIERSPKQRMKPSDVYRQNAALNAQRRRMNKSRG